MLPFVVFTLIWYLNDSAIYRQQIKDSEISQLNQLDNNLDLNLTHLVSLTQQMSMDPELMLRNQKVDTLRYQQALQRYIGGNVLIKHLYLYYNQDPQDLYASDGTYDVDATLAKYSLLSPADLSNSATMLHTKSAKLYFMSSPHTSKNFESSLSFFVPLMSAAQGIPYGTVIIGLDSDRLQEMLNGLQNRQSQRVFLFNQNRDAYFSSDNTKLPVLTNPPDFTRAAETQFALNNGYLHARVKNHSYGYSLLAIQKNNYNLLSLRSSISQFAIVSVAIFIIGIISILITNRRQYAPIKQIEALVWNQPSKNRHGENELADLQHSIRLFLNESRELKQNAADHLPFVQEHLIREKIKGRFDLETINHIGQKAQLEFPFQHFVIALAQLKEVPADTNLDQTILQFKFLKNTNYSVHGTEQLTSPLLALVINFSHTNQLNVYLADIVNQLHQRTRIDFTLFVGGANTDTQKLNYSFIEAVAASESAHLNATNIVYYQTPIKNDRHMEKQRHFYPDQELQLKNSLESGDSEVATTVLQKLYTAIFESSASNTVVNFKIYNLMLLIVKTGTQIGDPSFADLLNSL